MHAAAGPGRMQTAGGPFAAAAAASAGVAAASAGEAGGDAVAAAVGVGDVAVTPAAAAGGAVAAAARPSAPCTSRTAAVVAAAVDPSASHTSASLVTGRWPALDNRDYPEPERGSETEEANKEQVNMINHRQVGEPRTRDRGRALKPVGQSQTTHTCPQMDRRQCFLTSRKLNA